MQALNNVIPPRFKHWLLPAFCLLMAGAIAAVFLFDVSVSKLLLLMLLLACPLSHLLLGHGGHGNSAETSHHHLASADAVTPSESEMKAPR